MTKKYSVKIKNKNVQLGQNIVLAEGFVDRLLGLMFKDETYFRDKEGMILNPCNSIHTCFMKVTIDVLFIDKNNNVIKIIRQMKPWDMSGIYFRAKKVIELKTGLLPANVEVGDKVEILCIN